MCTATATMCAATIWTVTMCTVLWIIHDFRTCKISHRVSFFDKTFYQCSQHCQLYQKVPRFIRAIVTFKCNLSAQMFNVPKHGRILKRSSCSILSSLYWCCNAGVILQIFEDTSKKMKSNTITSSFIWEDLQQFVQPTYQYHWNRCGCTILKTISCISHLLQIFRLLL